MTPTEKQICIYLKDVGLTYPVFARARHKGARSRDEEQAGLMGQIQSKNKSIRSVAALGDISFSLKPGDRLALIGANGAGKTTLLRVLAGIYKPSSGDILVEGRIATLFQMGMGMRATASGYRNIYLQALLAGHSKSRIAELVEDVEDFTELGDFLHMPINTYSQGMAMRLNFAVATAIRPDILLMDEWLGAGDAKFRKKANQRMLKTFADAGISVIASHNLSSRWRL